MNIEQRNGRFRARLRLRGQPALSKTFNTKAAAEQWCKQMQDAAGTGTLADVLSAEVTFRQMLHEYADKVTPKKRGAHQELNRISQLESSPLADLKLSSISRRVLREFRDRRLRSVKGSSWNRQLSLITQVLRFAVREHDAKVDVKTLVGELREQESPGRTGRITAADEVAILDAAERVTPWCPALVKIALATGARRGELFNLRHSDVIRAGEPSVVIRGTKTKGSVRTLPISSATLAVIDSLPRNLTDDRLFWQAASPDRLTFAWRRAAAMAGRPHLVLHLARHEAISRLAEMGAPIPVLQKFSGHLTLSMIARYSKPEPEMLRRFLAA